MSIRLSLFAALATLTTFATVPAEDPPAAKDARPTTVMSLNALFKRDKSGATAKTYIGRTVTLSGTVKEVTEVDGGRTLALNGLRPTADEATGCTIPFAADYPFMKLVKELKPGMTVRVRGEIGEVTGMAFTLKSPALLGASVALPAKDGKAPAASPAPEPASKPPAPGAPPQQEAAPARDPKPEPYRPYRAEVALPAAERTLSAVELSTKLLADKDGTLERRYRGQVLEVTGMVRSCRPVQESIEKGAWSLDLVGAPARDAGPSPQVSVYFRGTSPTLERVRAVGLGDEVTVRVLFVQKFVDNVLVHGEAVPRGGDRRPALTPARQLTADDVFREVWAPGAVAKLRGQVVAVTGVIDLDPVHTHQGVDLPVRYTGAPPLAGIKCDVDQDQLDAVRQLPPGLRVKVVGVIAFTEPKRNEVWLGRCRLSLMEANPMPSVSVTELVTAYRDDNKAAGEKYGNRTSGKWLYLTGEIANITTDKMGLRTAHFKGPATGPQARIGIDVEWGDRVKVGQTIRVKTECQGALPRGVFIQLMGSSILPEAKTTLPVVK
ncbi:hypothetical protein [Fimbriiglobus ruber]|uniref:DUF5666 domain-containing protein n=1 Tax=Fimbriiglobus ruber TaxID=1908690 RepID=A0A225E6J9_9BACT|nr:hypothetical protein [Fimbriiglobus ruber]OWK45736.1 hypothetical protein FRUB_02067 [Fimbriiglobus ruber]